MGGLRKKMPITFWTFVIGSLALAGFPLTAGFFSKDEILASASNNIPAFLAIAGVTFLTAFYMFRLMGLTFWGSSRVDPHVEPKIHESPKSMTFPLVVLAAFSALIGMALGLAATPPMVTLLAGWRAC